MTGVCDNVNCGSNGVCIEKSSLPFPFYLCGCSNSTGNYAIPGPCPSAVSTTTTTTVASTLPPVNCLHGGKDNYDIRTVLHLEGIEVFTMLQMQYVSVELVLQVLSAKARLV